MCLLGFPCDAMNTLVTLTSVGTTSQHPLTCAVSPQPPPSSDSANITTLVQKKSHICRAIEWASTYGWNTHNVSPMLPDVVEILLDPDEQKVIAAMFETGCSKLHLIRGVNVVEHGAVLVYVPLLTLLADPIAKYREVAR